LSYPLGHGQKVLPRQYQALLRLFWDASASHRLKVKKEKRKEDKAYIYIKQTQQQKKEDLFDRVRGVTKKLFSTKITIQTK
jgi:hypothetical protein